MIYGESIDAEMSNNTKNIEEEVKYLRRQVKVRMNYKAVLDFDVPCTSCGSISIKRNQFVIVQIFWLFVILEQV